MWRKLVLIRIIEMLNLDSRKQEAREQKRQRYTLLIARGILCLAVIFVSMLVASTLIAIGENQLILGGSIFCTILLIFCATVCRVNEELYGYKEYTLLASLPISTTGIIVSRLVFLYLWNEGIAILILYPMNILYLAVAHTNYCGYVQFILLVLILPVVPMMVAVILNMIINYISYQFVYARVISRTLGLLMCILVPIGIVISNNKFIDSIDKFSIQLVSKEVMQQRGLDLFKEVLNGIPFVSIYTKVISEYNWKGFVFILLSSIVLWGITVRVLSKRYQSMYLKITTYSMENKNRKLSFKEKGELIALCEKEIRRFFSSGSCLLNLGIGPIFAVVFSISLFFGDADSVIQRFDYVGIVLGTEMTYDSMMISMTSTIMALVAVCCYSGISISLEGETIWILKSLPVAIDKIYLSKIMANVVMTIPISLLCSIITRINLKGQFIYSIFLFIVPVCYGIWTATMGLAINLKYPKLKWNTEIEVVKQSTSSLICMLGEIGIALVFAFAVQLVSGQGKALMMGGFAIFCLISSGILYFRMCRADELSKL